MRERKMSHEMFGQLLDELDGDGNEVLKEKNGRYSAPDDALHNFRAGTNFTGLTVAQTCWGYLSKHLTALKDMVDRNDFSNREDFMEKCKDPINYLRILWAIGNDEEYWKNHDKPLVTELDATCLKANKIGSPESMWQEVSVFNSETGECIRFYGLECEAVVDELRDGFIVASIDENRNETVDLYNYNKFNYKINNRKDK